MAAGVEFDEGDGFGGQPQNFNAPDQPPRIPQYQPYVPMTPQGVELSDDSGAVMKFIVKLGLAKNADQANRVMIVISLLSLAATGFVIFKFIL